ncbi:hypothetical protein GK011_19015 [Erwinia sp. J316]|uniref:Tryptophanase leader peptide n=1 Tax=Erwinia sorbitola TaxID=2681984 RepID=A0A6I6F7B2_9GAMM|nr:hypothetical protein [Erwinia sorbitola]QGU89780.1 hypothetical protein GN242_19305 [Erwinia sorbitola]
MIIPVWHSWDNIKSFFSPFVTAL